MQEPLTCSSHVLHLERVLQNLFAIALFPLRENTRGMHLGFIETLLLHRMDVIVLITIDLTVNEFDLDISYDGRYIYAHSPVAVAYQWYRCEGKKKIAIPGAIHYKFRPPGSEVLCGGGW